MNHEQLGRLLSLISHEVRAPLGVIRGYMRLLEQQSHSLPESHRHAVSAALKASDRATDILGQVSSLARLQRNEMTPVLRPTPVEPLLRAAVHAVSMPPEPIVTVHVAEGPALSVAGDEDLLRIAIAGLTSAVVRAQAADCRVYLLARNEPRAGRPGVRLTIGTTETEKDGAQVEAAIDIMRGGLGLDLPIAAFIVAAHDGEVSERHEDDRFAGISVWLPQS
jgi:two-component system sensor histidine kinase ArlS